MNFVKENWIGFVKFLEKHYHLYYYYYYQYFYLERNNWWFHVRFEIIKQTIQRYVFNGTPLKILNIGVATGAGSDMLSVFGNVVSSEYDEETCRFLKDELKIDVIQASVTALPFADNTFDLVCAFDVIEGVQKRRKNSRHGTCIYDDVERT